MPTVRVRPVRAYELEARAHELQACSSLVEVLRDLFRPRRPKVVQAEVVPFPADVPTRTGKEADREGSKAA